MAIKRDRVLKDAEKLVQKGKLEQAIREYEKILKRFPNDTTIINRVGDLYGRVGQLQRAIELYEEIADHFTQDGFLPKAIAILKKIQRLDPQRLDIFEKLAGLYVDQGLKVEAKREYQILADWYVKNGDLEKAIGAHEKLVELDPTNNVSSLRLADLLLRRGEVGSAIKVYDQLGSILLEANKLDEAERLYRRIMEKDPPEGDFLGRVCDAFLDAGRTPVALEFLQFATERSPDSVDLKVLLARTHLTMGENDTALSIAREVLELDPKNAPIRAMMGDALVTTGDVGEAREMLLPTVRELLDKGEHAAAQKSLRNLLEQCPDDQDVLKLAVRAWGPSDDQETLFTMRAALAESYFSTGELEAAKRLFIDLLQSEPENQRFRQRLAALDGVNEEYFKPAAEVAAADGVAIEEEPTDEVEEIVIEPEDLGPTAVAEETPQPTAVEIDEPEIPPPEVDPSGGGDDQPTPVPGGFDLEERLAEAAVFAKYGLVEKAISHLEDVVVFCPDEIEPRRRLALLYAEHGDRESAISTGQPVLEHYRNRSMDEQASGLLAAIPELGDAPPVMAGKGSLADEEGTLGAAVIEEPEQVGFTDEDSDLIEVVDIEGALADEHVRDEVSESEPAAAGEIEVGRDEAEVQEPWVPEAPPAAAAATPVDAAPTSPDPVLPSTEIPASASTSAEQDTADELVDVTGSFVGPSMSELEQIDFFIEQELFEDAVRVLAQLEEQHADNPEVVNRRLKLKDIGVLLEQVEAAGEGAEELFADEEQYIDLAKELEAELAAEEAMVDEATGRGKGEAILEDVFREFQKGVAEQLSEEDSDTHFNLGIAYREMGLLPEAIREFQVASRDTKLFVESCSIIGLCYQEQGMWSEAASWYQKALVAPDISEDARLGLRYDLAVAYEAAGDDEQALGIFAEILAADPTYRDVSNRLSNLSEQRQAN